MADEAKELTKAATWPYTSFKTLLNLILRLEEAKAIPPRIDRSFLGGSEGQKSQVLAALKFFGLIGNNGEVQPTFDALVMNTKERPKLIRDLLAKHYPEASKLAAIHATTRQLEETFTGLGGNTLRKAVTFYLHAAKYANHPVSKHFKVPSGFKTKRSPRASGGEAPPVPPVLAIPADPIAAAKARYLDMLLERAKTDNGSDKELYNRIERLLGIKTEPTTETDE